MKVSIFHFTANFRSLFNRVPNHMIYKANDLTILNVSPEECARRCYYETSIQCLSFDYDKRNGNNSCYLSSQNAYTNGGLVQVQGVDVYERITGIREITQLSDAVSDFNYENELHTGT